MVIRDARHVTTTATKTCVQRWRTHFKTTPRHGKKKVGLTSPTRSSRVLVNITGGHSLQGLRCTQKHAHFPIFTDNIWSYLIWSPAIITSRRITPKLSTSFWWLLYPGTPPPTGSDDGSYEYFQSQPFSLCVPPLGPILTRSVFQFFFQYFPDISVFSYRKIPTNTEISGKY